MTQVVALYRHHWPRESRKGETDELVTVANKVRTRKKKTKEKTKTSNFSVRKETRRQQLPLGSPRSSQSTRNECPCWYSNLLPSLSHRSRSQSERIDRGGTQEIRSSICSCTKENHPEKIYLDLIVPDSPILIPALSRKLSSIHHPITSSLPT